MLTRPAELLPLMAELAPLFSKPVWEHAAVLLVGAMLACHEVEPGAVFCQRPPRLASGAIVGFGSESRLAACVGHNLCTGRREEVSAFLHGGQAWMVMQVNHQECTGVVVLATAWGDPQAADVPQLSPCHGHDVNTGGAMSTVPVRQDLPPDQQEQAAQVLALAFQHDPIASYIIWDSINDTVLPSWQRERCHIAGCASGPCAAPRAPEATASLARGAHPLGPGGKVLRITVTSTRGALCQRATYASKYSSAM